MTRVRILLAALALTLGNGIVFAGVQVGNSHYLERSVAGFEVGNARAPHDGVQVGNAHHRGDGVQVGNAHR
jgi:hypothetical protein